MLQYFSWLGLKARVRSLLGELVQAPADSTPHPVSYSRAALLWHQEIGGWRRRLPPCVCLSAFWEPSLAWRGGCFDASIRALLCLP